MSARNEGETADVRVLPWVPDQPLPDGVEVAYPGDSFDIVKILEEAGLRVEWSHPVEERTTLEHKAADVWIPVLAFVSGVGAETCGSLLASAIENYLAPAGHPWCATGSCWRRQSARQDPLPPPSLLTAFSAEVVDGLAYPFRSAGVGIQPEQWRGVAGMGPGRGRSVTRRSAIRGRDERGPASSHHCRRSMPRRARTRPATARPRCRRA